jgi:hypothetical protein
VRRAPIVGEETICEHGTSMETPSETPGALPEMPAAESEAPASPSLEEPTGDLLAPSAEEQPARPGSFFKLERDDVLPFCLLIGFSAWLWSHASDSLGSSAAFIGAALGLVSLRRPHVLLKSVAAPPLRSRRCQNRQFGSKT